MLGCVADDHIDFESNQIKEEFKDLYRWTEGKDGTLVVGEKAAPTDISSYTTD